MSIFKFYKSLMCLLSLMAFTTSLTLGMESMECEEPKQMCEICKSKESTAVVFDRRFYTLPKKVCSIDCGVAWINMIRRIWHAPELRAFFPCENKCVACMDKNLSENGCMIFPCGHISLCLECYMRPGNEKHKCSICRGYEDNVAGYGITSFIYFPNNLRNKYKGLALDFKYSEHTSWIRNTLRSNYNKINIELPCNSDKLMTTKTKEGQIAVIATDIYAKNFYKPKLSPDIKQETDVTSLLNAALYFGNVFCKFDKNGNVFTSIHGDPKYITIT